MKKLLIIILGLCLASPAYAIIPRPLFQEQDGSPSIRPSIVYVSNDSMTDNGDGTINLLIGITPGISEDISIISQEVGIISNEVGILSNDVGDLKTKTNILSNDASWSRTSNNIFATPNLPVSTDSVSAETLMYTSRLQADNIYDKSGNNPLFLWSSGNSQWEAQSSNIDMGAYFLYFNSGYIYSSTGNEISLVPNSSTINLYGDVDVVNNEIYSITRMTADTISCDTLSAESVIEASNLSVRGQYMLSKDAPVSAGMVLSYDASGGEIVWGFPAGGGSSTPGGSDTQVQYNDGGSFNGSSAFTWNKTTEQLTLIGTISTDRVSCDTLSTDSGVTIGGNDSVIIFSAQASSPDSGAPTGPGLYVDSSDNSLRFYDGTNWHKVSLE